MAKTLIVDDDSHIRELICVFLKNEGYEILEAIDGVDALKKLDSAPFDLIVMDIMMPNMNGFELCTEVRKYYGDIPIIMLTVKGETYEKVKGFNLGADDYIVKPFEVEELIARIQALFKHYKITISQIVKFGNITLDKSAFEVKTKEKSLILPKKEFQLLFKLASYPEKTISREQLIEEIWGFDYEGDERTIDVHIKRLREKFQKDESGFNIKTIRGLGYRMEEL